MSAFRAALWPLLLSGSLVATAAGAQADAPPARAPAPQGWPEFSDNPPESVYDGGPVDDRSEPPPLGVEMQTEIPIQAGVPMAPRAGAARALVIDDPAEQATATVAAYYQGLSDRNPARVIDTLSPDASVVDDGRIQRRRDDYAATQLQTDLLAMAGGMRELLGREVSVSGDAVWVVSEWRVHERGDAGETLVDSVETMVLQRGAQGWKIVHLHRSRQPLVPAR